MMEVAQDCTSAGKQSTRRQRLYVEYLIDCPPCPREERRRLDLQRKRPLVGPGPAEHRGRRAISTSTTDEPLSPRSLPATPTTETLGPIFDDGQEHPAEFQRRMSPFRRGHRVKRPASATPVLSENASPSLFVLRPQPLQADGDHDTGTAEGAFGDKPMQVCSLQAMIRHRRTSSNISSSSVESSVSVPDHHKHRDEQVIVLILIIIIITVTTKSTVVYTNC